MNQLGTILPYATLKFIDDSGETPKWVTVAKFIDSPKNIREALEQAKAKYSGKTFWVHHVYGKEIVR
jgi:hypothetical protein